MHYLFIYYQIIFMLYSVYVIYIYIYIYIYIIYIYYSYSYIICSFCSSFSWVILFFPDSPRVASKALLRLAARRSSSLRDDLGDLGDLGSKSSVTCPTPWISNMISIGNIQKHPKKTSPKNVQNICVKRNMRNMKNQSTGLGWVENSNINIQQHPPTISNHQWPQV